MGQGFWGAFPRRHRLSLPLWKTQWGRSPRRHRLFLPLWKTQWGLSPGGTGYPCRCGARGGCFFGRLSPLPLALFLPPIPPPPLPRREGGDQSYFMQGASPLASPALNRLRHLFALPLWKTQWGLSPGGTCSTCPGGEDHLKRRRRLRRIVPSPPVPPLLGCRHCT